MSIPTLAFASLAALVLLTGSATAQAPHHAGPASGASSFEQLMAEAMTRMDEGMSAAHSGDADRDFAAMMIPHHQGAIDMAKAQLQYGRNPVLRRLAEGIIVEQQQEIEVMRRELQRLPSRAPSTTR